MIKISTIGCWIGGAVNDWFIPVLIALYIVYPLFYLYMNIVKNRWIILISIFIGYIILCNFPDGSNFMVILRYPTFFLGAFLGRQIIEGKDLKVLSFVLIFGVLLGFVLSVWEYEVFDRIARLNNGWYWIPYFIMTPGFCIVLGRLFDHMTNSIRNFLSYIGGMSLEIYLVHGFFIHLTQSIVVEYNMNKVLVGIPLILLSFLIAHLFHIINKLMMSVLNRWCEKTGLLNYK